MERARSIWPDLWKWALIALLAAVVGVAGSYSKEADVYTKAETEARITREIDTLGKQVDRTDRNVQWLIQRELGVTTGPPEIAVEEDQ